MVWQELVRRGVSNDDLCKIIVCKIIDRGSEKYKEKAWEQLLKQKPTDIDFRQIIRYAPDEWRGKAQAVLEERRKNEEIREQLRII
jgi:hypothetical protein